MPARASAKSSPKAPKPAPPAREVDPRLVKAIAHPLRFKILTLLNEGVASPKQLADRLGESLGTVSYHVRILADLECAELVGTTPRRGAVEHHYRATARPVLDDDDWAALPASVRRSIVGDVLARAWDDVAAASDANQFDRPDMHVTRVDLILDDPAAAELNDLLANVLNRALELHAESAGRLVEANDPASRETRLIMMHFDAPPGPRTGRPKRRPKRQSSSARDADT